MNYLCNMRCQPTYLIAAIANNCKHQSRREWNIVRYLTFELNVIYQLTSIKIKQEQSPIISLGIFFTGHREI